MSYDPISTWLGAMTPPLTRNTMVQPEFRFYIKGNGQRIEIARVIKKYSGTTIVENVRGDRVTVPNTTLRK